MIEQEISAKEVFAYVFKAVAQFKTALFVIIFARCLVPTRNGLDLQ